MVSKKAKEISKKLNKKEIDALKKMNLTAKLDYIVRKFGDENERFGISFGLYPLWAKEVLDEININ